MSERINSGPENPLTNAFGKRPLSQFQPVSADSMAARPQLLGRNNRRKASQKINSIMIITFVK